MPATQTGAMIGNREIQQGLATLFRRFAGARLAAFGQVLRFRIRLPFEPAIESVEVILA
jgi:hypothetical protein